MRGAGQPAEGGCGPGHDAGPLPGGRQDLGSRPRSPRTPGCGREPQGAAPTPDPRPIRSPPAGPAWGRAAAPGAGLLRAARRGASGSHSSPGDAPGPGRETPGARGPPSSPLGSPGGFGLYL